MEALVFVVNSCKHLVVFDSKSKLATCTTIGTNGFNFIESPPASLELEGPRNEGTNRADRDARSTKFAIQRAIKGGPYFGFDTTIDERVRTKRNYFIADTCTLSAMYATVHVALYERILVINLMIKFFILKAVNIYFIFIG